MDTFNFHYTTVKFTYGHAQKWINMTLKYMLALGESRIKGIYMNCHFFHIPIDNLIQDELLDKIEKINCAWSKINNYDIYLAYQKKFRKLCNGKSPIAEEFRIFNIT